MTITAKFAGICPCCNGHINAGDKVEWSKGSKARHVACGGSSMSAATPSRSYGRRYGSGAGSAASVAGYSSYCTDRPGCGCYDCAS